MNIDLDIQDIDRSHRVGRPNSTQHNSDIIVRFTSWRKRQRLMKSKKVVFEHSKKYKISYYVFEDLTRNRSEIAYHARQLKKSQDIKDTWTSGGKIFIKHFIDKISVCTRMHDLPKVSPTASNRKTYASAAREPVAHSVHCGIILESSWGPMFVGKQILLVRGDVISWISYAM